MRYFSVFILLTLFACSIPPGDQSAIAPLPESQQAGSSVAAGSEQSMSSSMSVLPASTSSAAEDPVAVMENSSDASKRDESSSSDSSQPMGAYIDSSADLALAESAIGNGAPALLFFHAPWCGFCTARDAVLRKIYEDGTYPISTYKIDYDTSVTLKKRYGITIQDTVVLVDGKGNALRTITGASQSDLITLISE